MISGSTWRLPAAELELAPAKVNLALHVRARLNDGYHALETLFAFTRFGDVLHAEAAADWSLRMEGPMAHAAGPLDDNLVLRAARAFSEACHSRQKFAFRLEKHIPVAAGLGGGSADAGAALRLLNRMTGAGLAGAELEAIGAGLGADVAACVRSKSCIGSGRGEQLRAVNALTGLPILLVNPRVAVPTGPVFGGWDGVDRGALGADYRTARNDLEAPALALQPVIGDVLAWLASLEGVTLARMSGSGATCFALLDRLPEIAVPHGWWSASSTLL